MKRQPITNVNVGDTFFLDLRYFDYTWYDQLSLPNAYVTTHVVPVNTWDGDYIASTVTFVCDVFFSMSC